MIICPNLKNPDVAREFNELKEATSEAAAYHIWSLNNGNGIDRAPNGAPSKLFLTLLDHYNGDRVKTIQAKAKTYGTSFFNWFGDWTGNSVNIPIDIQQQIDLLFERIPELQKIGSKELYYQYIQSIFPNSKDKSIYWHGSDSDFSRGFKSAKRGEGSGAPETKTRNDFYLARQAWTVLQYVSGVNRNSVDKNGFRHWNKLWWEFKEIMSNGRRENNDWKDLVINEQNVRQDIPNKRGGKGKRLSERKADYGYENKSDKEFFEEILGVKWGEDTFNTWTQRNAEIFKSLLKDTKGIYPAVINAQNPITESGLNTYYEELRGLMTKADKEGNDAILSEKADNEFNSDVAVVLNASEKNIHFLGTEEDLNNFKNFVQNSVSKVVDENGEPLVVYRGDSNGKSQFNPTTPSYNVRGIYFFGNKRLASNYTKPSFYNNFTEGVLYEVFINAKNPIYNSRDVEGWNNGKYDTNDSWIYGNFPDGNGELVVRNSNQIKSATDNNGMFSTESMNSNNNPEFPSILMEVREELKTLQNPRQQKDDLAQQMLLRESDYIDIYNLLKDIENNKLNVVGNKQNTSSEELQQIVSNEENDPLAEIAELEQKLSEVKSQQEELDILGKILRIKCKHGIV